MGFFYEILLIFVKTTRFFDFLFLGTFWERLKKLGTSEQIWEQSGTLEKTWENFNFLGTFGDMRHFLGTCDIFWEHVGIFGNVPKFGTPMHIILEASSPSGKSTKIKNKSPPSYRQKLGINGEGPPLHM
jgi:hypothetical protein